MTSIARDCRSKPENMTSRWVRKVEISTIKSAKLVCPGESDSFDLNLIMISSSLVSIPIFTVMKSCSR